MLLAQVFGIYFSVVGLMILIRRNHFRSVMNGFAEAGTTRFMFGLIMFVAGLFLIRTHHDWSTLPAAIISLMGWAITIKSLLHMNLSDNAVKKWIGMTRNGSKIVTASIVSLIIGIYLLNFGFALGWF